MSFLASDVMDAAAALLNDTALSTFSYAAQLPYVKRANEILETVMLANGISVQRQVSAVLTVPVSAVNNDLSGLVGYPSDMLVPIRCWERTAGSGLTYSLMTELDWEPEIVPTVSLTYWVFRNNKIYTPGSTASANVKVDYWRQLSAITAAGSSEEVAASKVYLSAKTAELCARYIGQNKEIADDLLTDEVGPAQDLLERIYVKNSQGTRSRRRRFTRPRTYYAR